MRTVSLIALVLAATLAISCGSSEPPPSEPAAEQPKAPEPEIEPAREVEPEVEPEQVEPAPETEQPTKPSPVAARPPLDSSCTADADCVPAPGCCPKPCTSIVINRSALPEAKQRLEELCPKPPQCGSAGGCRTHAYLCVEGTCSLVYEGDPHYRERRSQ